LTRLPQTIHLPEKTRTGKYACPTPVPGRRIGIHTSIAGAISRAPERAHQLGCNTFQIFSTSPRQWKASQVSAAEARLFHQAREKHGLRPLVIHANYLVNLASPNAEIRRKSIESFRAELERAVLLGAEYLVTHPGSALNGDRIQAMARFISGVERAARGLRLGGLTVLVENTAGGGGALGSEFEELRAFVQLTERVPLACCIDTAHLYQSGWDVSTEKGLAATLARLDAAVGLDNIPVIHTNDSRTALGSRADRHQHIGKGGIGLAGFRRILNHPRLRHKAFILETPIDKKGDDLRNLDVARSLVQGTRKAPRNPRTRSND